MVDWVLPLKDMSGKLVEFLNNERRVCLPQEAASKQDSGPLASSAEDDVALRDVLSLLRARTGSDFTGYKHATTLRRIGRRMQVNGIESLPGYAGFLQFKDPPPGPVNQSLRRTFETPLTGFLE